ISAGLLLLVPLVAFRRRKQRLRPSAQIVSAYVLCGTMALLLVSVMPTLGFFKAGWELEAEALLKSGQLTLAQRLKQRLEFIASRSIRDDPGISRYYTVEHFFGSLWWLTPAPAASLKVVTNFSRIFGGTNNPDRSLPEGVPEFFQRSIPQYSEFSIALRDLRQPRASDDSWHTIRRGRLLRMEKKVSFDHAAAQRIYGAANVPTSPSIVIVSQFPSLLPRFLLSQAAALPTIEWTTADCAVCLSPISQSPLLMPLRWVCYLSVAVILVLLMRWIVRFIARKVFLMDLQAPRWLFSRSRVRPTLGDHIFLVRRVNDAEGLVDVDKFARFSFSSLTDDDAVSKELIALDSPQVARSLFCRDFTIQPIDSEKSMRQLVFLERLMNLPDRTVIIDSTVSPLLIQTIASAEKPKGARRSQRQRWISVLSRFIWLTEDQVLSLKRAAKEQGIATAVRSLRFRARLTYRVAKLRLRWWVRTARELTAPLKPRTKRSRRPAKLSEWLFREVRSDAFLTKLVEEMQPQKYSQEETLDELLERAETYYGSLWASCADEEKVLLQHLAKHGFVNGKNRKAIRRLIARGLVRKAPNVRVFSETFRRYVLDQEGDAALVSIEEKSAGLWNSLRVPIGLVVLTVTVVFFASQKDLLNLTTTIVTGLAAGLPAIVKLVGMISERRLDGGTNS
ncbi:MAG TPA: hypothetical protein VNN08_23520, partial [Thermoanaerobaculia bacterium]|nr:hypothetical protein [Thermoanaerobaculia bacterium]